MDIQMKKAYAETIADLEIELRNCGLFEFGKRKLYRRMISEYEQKINA
jgi:hypothetical protein